MTYRCHQRPLRARSNQFTRVSADLWMRDTELFTKYIAQALQSNEYTQAPQLHASKRPDQAQTRHPGHSALYSIATQSVRLENTVRPVIFHTETHIKSQPTSHNHVSATFPTEIHQNHAAINQNAAQSDSQQRTWHQRNRGGFATARKSGGASKTGPSSLGCKQAGRPTARIDATDCIGIACACPSASVAPDLRRTRDSLGHPPRLAMGLMPTQ